jgi:hypothetical protein
MQWTLKLECRSAEGALHSITVAKIERPELLSQADLGLTLDSGKHVLRQVQAAIVADQVRSFVANARQCPCCGRVRSNMSPPPGPKCNGGISR